MNLYAVLIASFSFLFQMDWAPDLGDEGFLWYGALQTFRGQVPLLDFQSYFPGRYYFTAGLFHFLGQDLLAVRIAGWFFQVLALLLVCWIARRASVSKINIILLGVLTVFWMTVPFRYFDSALVIAAVFFAVRLLEKPTQTRHFWAGVFTGGALFFGVNHGFYSFIIFQGLTVLNAFKTEPKSLLKNELSFLAGSLAGCLPLLFMVFFIPGFWTAFTDNIGTILSRNNDTPLPFPWPWEVSWSMICVKFPEPHQRILEFIHRLSLGISFLIVPIFYAASLVFVLQAPKNKWRSHALWSACAVVGTVYVHHILRRVNIVYLGEAITPFLIGVWAWGAVRISGRNKTAGFLSMSLLVVLTALGPGLLHNGWYRIFLPEGALSQVQIGPRRYWTETKNAREIESVRRFVKENVPENETIFLAPLLPMVYCLLDKVSPVHQLYFVFPESEEHQKKMIGDLEAKKVQWAIVGDPVMDGLSHLHFSNTHSLLWRYLNEKFDPYVVEGFPKGHFLWKRR